MPGYRIDHLVDLDQISRVIVPIRIDREVFPSVSGDLLVGPIA